MSALVSVAKRTLNIGFIACSLWTVFILVAGFIALLSGKTVDWHGWFTEGALPAISGYIALAVISYIFFGKATLWHRQASAPQA